MASPTAKHIRKQAGPQAQGRIREAITRSKKEHLTALLHHVSIDCLRWAFFNLNCLSRVTPFTRARAKKLPRAAECLVHSSTPSRVLAENHPKDRGFVGILRGQKCLRRRFLRRSPVGEWSRGARSMPRVFGRGSRSQPAALVSDRDDAALFPAIRIRERYGSAKSGRARRVRAGSLV